MGMVKENNIYEVLTKDGFKDFDGISINSRNEMIYIETSNGYNLTCTIEHLIETPNNFIEAIELKIGDTVITENGIDEIICKEIFYENNEVFDLLNVKDNNSFICNGISVHNCLIIDERAFIPHNLWDAFLSSVYPTVSSSPTSRVIYVSTFCGLNHFYRDWNDATEGASEFEPIRVDWWEVPGRDEKWKAETIANIGQTRFNQEYGNQALGSITTLVDPKVITELKHAEALNESTLLDKFDARLHPYFKLYEDVKKGHQYVIGADSAKMTEESIGDALGMQVLDITVFPIRQVCVFFAKKGVSYLQSPEIIFTLGHYFNNAIVFVENNEIGQEVANMLHFDLEYENVYFEKGSLPGFRTTKKTKRLGCENLRLLIEHSKLILRDFDTISQLSTFIKKKMSYEAEKGYQDDLIMSLIASIFFLLAEGLDVGLIENNAELAKIIGDSGVKEDDSLLDIVMPDDDLEIPKGDFHWL
jgi:hypothetical protein